MGEWSGKQAVAEIRFLHKLHELIRFARGERLLRGDAFGHVLLVGFELRQKRRLDRLALGSGRRPDPPLQLVKYTANGVTPAISMIASADAIRPAARPPRMNESHAQSDRDDRERHPHGGLEHDGRLRITCRTSTNQTQKTLNAATTNASNTRSERFMASAAPAVRKIRRCAGFFRRRRSRRNRCLPAARCRRPAPVSNKSAARCDGRRCRWS